MTYVILSIDIQKCKEYDKDSIKVSFLYEKQKKEKALKNGAANIVKKVTQELMNSKCPMSDSLDEKQYSVAFYTK